MNTKNITYRLISFASPCAWVIHLSFIHPSVMNKHRVNVNGCTETWQLDKQIESWRINCDSCVQKLRKASVSFSVSLSLNPLIFHAHSQTIFFFQFSFLITTFSRLSAAWNLSRSTVSNRTDTAQYAPALKQDARSFSTSASESFQYVPTVLLFSSQKEKPPAYTRTETRPHWGYPRLAAPNLRVALPISGRQSSEVSSFLNQFQDIPFWTFSRLFYPTWKLSYLL